MSNVKHRKMMLSLYEAAVVRLLLDFQWIELLLRVVVGTSYDVLNKCAPDPIRFMPSRALAKDSLGKLIEKYTEVSKNSDVVPRLKAVVKQRNHYAHQSFILSVDEQKSDSFLRGEVAKMTELKTETHSLVMLLQSEVAQLARLLREEPSASIERQGLADEGTSDV